MSVDGDFEQPPQEVIDDDGDVDKAIKRRIVKARERVDETELALWRDAELDPQIRGSISEAEKIRTFAMTVQQFLRRIEPLFRVDGIENNREYYTEIDVGEITLYPPDTDGYQFSMIGRVDGGEQELRRMLDLPRGVDVPEPVQITITGLQEVIEREPVLSYQWSVCVAKQGARPNWEYVYPSVTRPMGKKIYKNAIRMADLFLQEAGIGLDTETKGTEIIRDFDMSGEEPQGKFTTGQYDANPDI